MMREQEAGNRHNKALDFYCSQCTQIIGIVMMKNKYN